MKKLIFSLVFMSVILSGCSVKNMYRIENTEYNVASIGFERGENSFSALFEVIIINNDDADSDLKRAVIKGEGETLDEAVSAVRLKTAQPLLLSHTAIIVLSDGITKADFNEIYNYCLTERDISVAVGFVTAKSAEELLGLEPISSVSIGYTLADMLKTGYLETKYPYKNRLYESFKRNKEGFWKLPYFEVKDSEYYLNGTKNQII